MAIDFKALGAKAAAEGADQTKAVAGGGGDYAPPAAGPGMARFVAYVELGKQKGMMKGKEEIKEKVLLIFELCGKRHPPREAQDGTKIPYRISVEVNFSLNEKAHFFKLFQRMNYKQDAVHMVQLLGEGYKVEVLHRAWKDRQGNERIEAELQGPDGFTIYPPRREALEEEESDSGYVVLAVPPAISEPKAFIWAQADLDQWGSIFIEGEYPERKDDKGVVTAKAKSKNVMQNKIKQAVNFEGSPIHVALLASGGNLDLPDVDDHDEEPAAGNAGASAGQQQPTPSTTSPSKDALGGIV